MRELTKSQKTNARRKARTDDQVIADQRRLRPTGVKMCPKCESEYPLSSFSDDRYRADGLSVACVDCWAMVRTKNKGYPSPSQFWKECPGCSKTLHINKFKYRPQCPDCHYAEVAQIKESKRAEIAEAAQRRAAERERRKLCLFAYRWS